MIGRLIAMAGWLVVAVIGFYAWKLTGRANPWPRRFLAGIARIAGVRIRTSGQLAAGRLMMLANHTSWIDIPTLAQATGAAFVAHDGLARVRLLKWLCDMNGTIFITRDHRSTIAAQVDIVRAALTDRSAITIFPEGSTSDGTALPPFKSALLASLDPLPEGIAVQPVWLDYGRLVADIAWVGEESGAANFLRILARTQPIDLTIHFLEPLAAAALANRKSMASAAHQAIVNAMALQNANTIA